MSTALGAAEDSLVAGAGLGCEHPTTRSRANPKNLITIANIISPFSPAGLGRIIPPNGTAKNHRVAFPHMGIYEEIGVRPFINASGCMYTRFGGSIMAEPVVAAMAEASKHFVNIFDLQNRVGDAIAAMTRNESAFISCGAASGISLAVATCIAGTDANLADRLPDTHGIRNQIIISRCDRGTEADPAVRAAGGRIVEIGQPNTSRRAGSDEYLHAITDQTAAILFIAFESEAELDVGRVISAAHEKNVPVLIDGACAVPPKENLWHYTRDLGVDAFITSGGKGIRGPQSTGLVLGKREIIEGCKFHSSPNLRIGRGMKVGKEEFAGIYTALKLFLAADPAAEIARDIRRVAHIADALKNIPGILSCIVEKTRLQIKFDQAVFGITCEEAAKILLESDPSILLRGRDNRLTIHVNLLQDGEEELVARNLREFFTKRLQPPVYTDHS
jgi:L-seryl-tRNA(Ser) seleniumtransferase